MAVLKKLEYFVSDNGTDSTEVVIEKIKTELNRKQELASNKVGNEYKNLYFASFFDPKVLKQFLIFSNATKSSGHLSLDYYDLAENALTKSDFAEFINNNQDLKTEIQKVVNTLNLVTQTQMQEAVAQAAAGDVDLSGYATNDYVDSKISEVMDADAVTIDFINSLRELGD